MSTDNLLALQRSARPIRNPFGFNFETRWDGQSVVLEGDGKWHTYVGPLAAHIVRHLKMAVLYKYHDEQVERLRNAGDEKGARKYNVPIEIRNKVHLLITGEDDPELKGQEDTKQLEIDFSALQGEIKKIDRKATASAAQGEAIQSVSHILDSATAEATKAGRTVRGSDIVNQSMPTQEKEQIPLEPLDAGTNVPPQEPAGQDETPVSDQGEQADGGDEFADLDEME